MLHPVNLCEASCVKGTDVSSIFSGLSSAQDCHELTHDKLKGGIPTAPALRRQFYPEARGTYRWRMILRTRGGFRSAACRQPASGSTRSGRCRRWSRRRARSHCCTGGKGQERQC